MKSRIVVLVSIVAMICFATALHAGVPSQINVQGRLTDSNGDPLVPGVKTLSFRIYNDSTGGIAIWPLGSPAGEVQPVTTGQDGLWTAYLGALYPLPAGLFADTVRWLEIRVQEGVNPEVTLPRVRLLTGPYAFRVASIDGATGGVVSGRLITGTDNSFSGSDIFEAGRDNSATGEQASIAGGHDNTADGEGAFIGGGYANQAIGEVAFVGGGHDNTASSFESAIAGGKYNQAGDAGFVGGGLSNRAVGVQSSVGGGHGNAASNVGTAVMGGFWNKARGEYSVVCGGGGLNDSDSNVAHGNTSFVGGGSWNRSEADGSAIAGGFGNVALGYRSFVGGGELNLASGEQACIAGGQENTAEGDRACVGGGDGNQALGEQATVCGGTVNYAGSRRATIAGGAGNQAGEAAFVGGGDNNAANGAIAVVAGGKGNLAKVQGAAILGGSWNRARGEYSVVCGGGGSSVADSNLASGPQSVVGGGSSNYAGGQYASIGGGGLNSASGLGSVIAGGTNNVASNTVATVAGGTGNSASGYASTASGGLSNAARGNYSFAAGYKARANHYSSFVWGDLIVDDVDSVASDTSNQFKIRAANGVRISSPAGSTKTIRTGDRYRDNAICSWAKVRGSDGATSANDFGVVSVVRNSAGNYTVTVDVNATDPAALVPVVALEVDTPPTTAAGARLIYMNQVNTNVFDVYITNGSYQAADNDFVFMATAR